MAQLISKVREVIDSRNMKTGEVVETVVLWRVQAVDDFGAKHYFEFNEDPSDQTILDKLPKAIELNPTRGQDASDYVKVRVERWFGLKQVRLEAQARLDAAMESEVAVMEEAAWRDVKTAVAKLKGA